MGGQLSKFLPWCELYIREVADAMLQGLTVFASNKYREKIENHFIYCTNRLISDYPPRNHLSSEFI